MHSQGFPCDAGSEQHAEQPEAPPGLHAAATQSLSSITGSPDGLRNADAQWSVGSGGGVNASQNAHGDRVAAQLLLPDSSARDNAIEKASRDPAALRSTSLASKHGLGKARIAGSVLTDLPGLTDTEAALVQRFDPAGPRDTIGFFIAKFVKDCTL